MVKPNKQNKAPTQSIMNVTVDHDYNNWLLKMTLESTYWDADKDLRKLQALQKCRKSAHLIVMSQVRFERNSQRKWWIN